MCRDAVSDKESFNEEKKDDRREDDVPEAADVYYGPSDPGNANVHLLEDQVEFRDYEERKGEQDAAPEDREAQK